MSNTILLPFQPDLMTPAQLAAVSYLAHTRATPTACAPTNFGCCRCAFRREGVEGAACVCPHTAP
jgi:hypothetical protein